MLLQSGARQCLACPSSSDGNWQQGGIPDAVSLNRHEQLHPTSECVVACGRPVRCPMHSQEAAAERQPLGGSFPAVSRTMQPRGLTAASAEASFFFFFFFLPKSSESSPPSSTGAAGKGKQAAQIACQQAGCIRTAMHPLPAHLLVHQASPAPH